MNKSIQIILIVFIAFITIISSCKTVKTEPPELNYDCLYSLLDEMQSYVDTAAFGDVDGTYTFESEVLLNNEIEKIQYAISSANADRFFLQYEIDNYCVAAEKTIEDFKNSYQITLDPGTPAELIVYGIDQKGRIEFGADKRFGGSKAFTVESWIKYDEGFYESAIGDFIATFNNTADPFEGWMINFMGDNLRATIGMGPQSYRVLEFGSPYPKNYGEWNHIAMVYDEYLTEGQLKMYLNGELFFSKTNDIYNESGELQSYVPNTQNLNMWAFQEPTDLSRCMTGYIKKFRMWDSAKSIEEIRNLMNTDVTGTEDDIICAWDFTVVPENADSIPDKTGRFNAKLVGKYKWFPLN